ncbi:MAG: diaminopimelate epimerase [Deltaproteobacteria bacterium]|nr:diaminopimelate epimerase [Deltaproteobacteria bacterium]MBW2253629.1 diaminopimelate epimerase [Deltaproteobacteria bacterium]
MRLARAHGLGNDYLVLEGGGPLTPELVRALCDRHRGVGADGVLEPRAAAGTLRGVRIWNPDGSIAEKSGNGLRIFAWWLTTRGEPASCTLWTGTHEVRCRVRGTEVEVDMGPATFEDPVEALIQLGDGVRPAVVVSVGNPHCVLFVDAPDLDALPWREWGAELETHPRFPNRTNVQVARLRGDGGVEIRVWERGAGPTLASGSSACAVAAAAVETGRIAAGRVPVHMPGGTLQVSVGPTLVLEGPVEQVGVFEVDPGWLATRTASASFPRV